MGIQWFDVHLAAIFWSYRESIELAINRKTTSCVFTDNSDRPKSRMGTVFVFNVSISFW